MAKNFRSKIAGAMYRSMVDLHESGAVDKQTMREFDRRCLTKIATLSAADIRAIRETAGVCQPVFAEHISVTTGLVSKWECGDKRPSRMVLKLLAVVRSRWLAVVA